MRGRDVELGESVDERAPLLQVPGTCVPQDVNVLPDTYKQFCHLVGNKPVDYPQDQTFCPPRDALYHRALNHRKMQARMYIFSSTLTNGLLLSQIALGAALTGLGASNASAVLITVFGALNTIIAGLIAFLKSRGQPMRARMFRDDLDRVVDEIENSATMWRGISQKVHGYDAIDTDESVTVRSEVARLTRLYDRAVRTNTMNDPDFYGSGISADHAGGALRGRGAQALLPVAPPPQLPAAVSPAAPVPTPAIPGPAADPDESPATKAPTPPPKEAPDSNGKQPEKDSVAVPSTTPETTPAPAPAPTPAPADPDASPATALKPPGSEKGKGQAVPPPASQPETSDKVPGSPPDADAGASKSPGGFT